MPKQKSRPVTTLRSVMQSLSTMFSVENCNAPATDKPISRYDARSVPLQK